MAKARLSRCYIDLYGGRVTASASTPKANQFLLARCRILGVYGVRPIRVYRVYFDRELISVADLASELPALPTLHIDVAECEGAGLELGTYRGGGGACAPYRSRDVGGAFLD